MCYSSLVERALSKLARRMRANIQADAFVDLYAMRVRDPSLKIPLGMDAGLIELGGPAARSIEKSIREFRSGEETRIAQQLGDLHAEIREIEARLTIKMTKTQRDALAVKLRKRDKLLLGDQPSSVEGDSYRIYPLYFAPVMTIEGDERIITPMRYRILPRTGVEVPTKYNVFNARRDSLTSAQNWKPLFGAKHAVFPFIRFYEWVVDKKTGKKIEVSFTPDGFAHMWAASLFEEYRNPELGVIRSFAMVTDEPPPEVRDAGHDRCPVFLDNSLLDDWMAPKGKSLEYLDRLLDAKEPTYYSHAKAA